MAPTSRAQGGSSAPMVSSSAGEVEREDDGAVEGGRRDGDVVSGRRMNSTVTPSPMAMGRARPRL